MTSLPLADAQRDVASLFLATFDRAPEFDAMQWYLAQYHALLQAQDNAPAARDNALKLLASQIYADGVTASEVPAGPTVSNAWYVAHVYGNVLGRQPDADGAAWWTAQLDSGAMDRGGLVAQIIAAARGSEGSDAQYVSHRETVAMAFAEWPNSNAQVLADLRYNATDVMIGVDASQASVAAGLNRLYDVTRAEGEHLALTPGIDTLEGTVRNDTFNAWSVNPATGEAASTLTAFDHLDGGAGHDTFNLYIDAAQEANLAFPDTSQVRAIETVKLHYANGTAVAGLADARFYDGVEALWQVGAAADVTGLSAGVMAGLRHFGEVDDVSFSALPGTDLVQLAFDDTRPAVEPPRVAVHVEGDDVNQVRIDGHLAHHNAVHLGVTVGGDGDRLTLHTAVNTEVGPVLNADGDWVSTLDASQSTGNVGWILVLPDTVALGGAGDDTFSIDDGSLSLNTTIDGGTGFNTVALLQSSFQTQDYDALSQLQNVQQLAFNSEQVVLNAAEVSSYGSLRLHDLEQDPDNFQDVQSAIFSHLAFDQELVLAARTKATLDLIDADSSLGITLEAGSHLTVYIDANHPGASGGMLAIGGQAGSLLTFNNAIGWDAEEQISAPLEQGKFSVIDVSTLAGSLDLRGLSADTAETVRLGSGEHNEIQWQVGTDSEPGSSSIGRLDVIEGFDAQATQFYGLGSITQLELSPGVSTLQQAWAEAAAAYATQGSNVLFFHFDDNTWVYADTVDTLNARYDNDDFAFRIDGLHDLTA